MKKNYISALLILCLISISMFTACDSDDTNPADAWKDLSGTYQEKTLNPTLNGRILIVGGKSVEVQVNSGTEAILTLNHVFPDAATVSMDVDLSLKDGQYHLNGEIQPYNTTYYSVEGFFDQYGILNIDLTRKVAFPVTGSWSLNYKTDNSGSSADVYVYAQTANPTTNGLINTLAGPAVGQLIADKVMGVNLFLDEDGSFNVSWRKSGEVKDTYLPDYIMEAINIQYTVLNTQLLLAMDKNLITLVESLIPILDLELNIEDILPLLIDLGGYYAIPIHMDTRSENTLFYLSKEIVIPALDILGPLLLSSLPENLLPLIEPLLAELSSAEVLDFGLVFQPD